MTKKDYQMLAALFSEAMSMRRADREVVVWLAENLADKLKVDNARFDRARFLKAAGVIP